MRISPRAYRLMLYAYPKSFRDRFGVEMQQVFRDRQPRYSTGMVLRDWVASAFKERMAAMTEIARTRLWKTAKGLGIATAGLAVCLAAGSTMLRAYVIPTPSMETSLRVGDHVLVNKLVHGGDLHLGDLVTFRYPVDPRQTFIKRVIGLPGDHIRIADKQVFRNRRRLIEPYVEASASSRDPYRDNFPTGIPPAATPPAGLDMLAHHLADGEVVVPPDSLFVLGDNRDLSLDSRYWGFVPMASIIGKPVIVYWSYDAAASKTRWNRTLLNLSAAAPREQQ